LSLVFDSLRRTLFAVTQRRGQRSAASVCVLGETATVLAIGTVCVWKGEGVLLKVWLWLWLWFVSEGVRLKSAGEGVADRVEWLSAHVPALGLSEPPP
jgi:hypothetical protein